MSDGDTARETVGPISVVTVYISQKHHPGFESPLDPLIGLFPLNVMEITEVHT